MCGEGLDECVGRDLVSVRRDLVSVWGGIW